VATRVRNGRNITMNFWATVAWMNSFDKLNIIFKVLVRENNFDYNLNCQKKMYLELFSNEFRIRLQLVAVYNSSSSTEIVLNILLLN
jgi:hypothetical protein